MTGFEPATLWTQTTRSTKLSYTLKPDCSGEATIRRCVAFSRSARSTSHSTLAQLSGTSVNSTTFGLSPRRTTFERSITIRYRRATDGTSGSPRELLRFSQSLRW